MPRTAGPQPPGRRAPADRLHPSSPARYCRANSLSAPAHQPRAHPIRPAASSTGRPGSIAPQLIRDDRPPRHPHPPARTAPGPTPSAHHSTLTTQPDPAHRQRRTLRHIRHRLQDRGDHFIHPFYSASRHRGPIGRRFRAMPRTRPGSVIFLQALRELRERLRRGHVRGPSHLTPPGTFLHAPDALAPAGIPQMSDIARDPQAALPVRVARTRYSHADSRHHSRIPLTHIIRAPRLSSINRGTAGPRKLP